MKELDEENLKELIKYVDPKRKAYLAIAEGLDGLRGDFISMFIIDPYLFSQTNLEILKILRNEKNLPGIYITGNMPYETLIDNLNENNIDTKDITFIDCVSKRISRAPELYENCYFVESIERLDKLDVIVEKVIERSGEKELFVFLDSVSTLLIYHNEKVVEKFMHLLTNKFRKSKGIKAIFVATKSEENTSALDNVAQFCNRVIKIE